MTAIRFDRDVTVQTVLDAWPLTRSVFIRRRMACVGCDLAPFMTIAEAAGAYGIGPDALVAELEAAAAASAPAGVTQFDLAQSDGDRNRSC